MASFNVTMNNANVEKDAEAAALVVGIENAKREEADQSLLPVGDVGELKASYEWCLEQTLLSAHTDYQRQAAEAMSQEKNAKDLWEQASVEQRNAAIAALGG